MINVKKIINGIIDANKNNITEEQKFKIFGFTEELVDDLMYKLHLYINFVNTNIDLQDIFQKAFVKKTKYILNIERQMDFNAFVFDVIFKFYANARLSELKHVKEKSVKILASFMANREIFDLINQTNDLLLSLNLSKEDFLQLSPTKYEDDVCIEIFRMPYQRSFSSELANSCIVGFNEAIEKLATKQNEVYDN